MSISISSAKKIPRDPARLAGLDQAAGILHVASHYKSADRQIKAGCDLFRFGERSEAIYALVDGWVALYNVMEDGRRQILQFALPGTVLAFVPTRTAVVNYSAQALTDATVSVVPHEKLEPLSQEHPEIGMQLAGLIAQDRSLAYDHLSSIGQRSARERVAYLLLELFIRSRLRWPGHRSEEMHLPITQEHIGDATGLTGVHVNRVLNDLRKEGIAEFHYRRLRILNPDKLVEVAGVEPHVALTWIRHDSSDEVLADRRQGSDVGRTVRIDAIPRRSQLGSRAFPPCAT